METGRSDKTEPSEICPFEESTALILFCILFNLDSMESNFIRSSCAFWARSCVLCNSLRDLSNSWVMLLIKAVDFSCSSTIFFFVSLNSLRDFLKSLLKRVKAERTTSTPESPALIDSVKNWLSRSKLSVRVSVSSKFFERPWTFNRARCISP